MRFALLLLVACGAPPPPPPVTKPPVRRVAKHAPISCGDVAVILRGEVRDETNAGPMKEEAIARACLHDHWEQAVIDCIGGEAPRACLDKLAPEQRAAYRDKLEAWADTFPNERLDLPDEPEPERPLECAFAIGDVAQYMTLPSRIAGDRELTIAMRRTALLALCEDWSAAARTCFSQNAPAKCLDKLEPDQRQDLHDRLAEIDALMSNIATAGAPTCDKVVKAHYGDDRWKGKLTGVPDRKRLITESRTRMAKACVDDKWSDALRGCIVAGDRCWLAAGITPETWGFPASGIPIKTGIAECDAYGDTLRALAACNQIPRQAAQTMLDNFKAMAAGLANMPATKRASAAISCKTSENAIRQSAASLGCTI